jgi:hypothetical protein
MFSAQSDHFFRVVEKQIKEPPTAAQYMTMRLEPTSTEPKRLIFVATPGGGIQAAAWTDEVLAGLDERNKKHDERNKKPGFRESVAAISSVSGGSLGSIIYAASIANKIEPGQVAPNARRSAIDEVAWGWTVPDFWRAIIPWFRVNRALDRGWALEKKWSAINNLDDTGDAHGTFLSDWTDFKTYPEMPALLINSMLVERGEPVVFSNTRFPIPSRSNRIENFYDLYKNQYLKYDVRVNTAARLSASFSYVAPSPRPDLNGIYGEAFHFVDGGYYDNSGITALLEWLREALDDPTLKDASGAPRIKDILILRIQHFNPEKPPSGTKQGWGFQLIAPPDALYMMRDYAQESTALKELELFGKYYGTQSVNVWETTIHYIGAKADGCEDAPLSWKLDQHQQDCIIWAWEGKPDQNGNPKAGVLQDQTEALGCIASYLGGGAVGCKKGGDAAK